MKPTHFLPVVLFAHGACGDASGPGSGNHQQWTSITTGAYHSCGTTVDGAAYCWGLNSLGALGNGDSVRASVRPVRVIADLRFKSVSVGGGFSCALTTLGKAYCWGTGLYGALGNGQDKSSATPVAVAGDGVFAQISVGFLHACAVTASGEAYCWGDNAWGKLGDGTEIQRWVPTRVAANVSFRSISAGNLHTCAIDVDYKAYCWGQSGDGEVGVGASCVNTDCPTWSTPQPIASDQKFVSISAGNTFTCAVSTSADAWCWGALSVPWAEGLSKLGVLGNGQTGGSAIPVKVVGNHRFTEVAAGTRSACGVTELGEGYCWGTNSSGELGIGRVDDIPHPTPTLVSGNIAFSHIAAAESSCGLDRHGAAYCWAMVVGEPDAEGGILVQGLWTRPTPLPDPPRPH